VLFVSQTYNLWGGMEKWLDDFSAWIAANTDWDVRVGLARGFIWNDPQKYLAVHPQLNAEFLDVRIGTWSVRVSAIAAAIERLRPDIVIPVLTGAIFEAVAQAKRRGSETRLLMHVQSLIPTQIANVVEAYPTIDGLVTTNRLFHRYFLSKFGDAERIHYVRQGARPPAETPRIRGESDAPLRIGYVGRIEQPAKRILDVIPFAAELHRRGVAAEVHLFGAGQAEAEVRAGLERSGVPFVLHGYRTPEELERDAWPLLDVKVLFSETEGATPFAVCEAMMHGVVPVITRYPGQVAEAFVRHEENGFTFPVGRTELAADCVERLTRDRALLQRMSRAAYETARPHTDERMHRAYFETFETILALPQKRGPIVGAPVKSGRLDYVFGGRRADRLRALTGQYYRHVDSRAEWPEDAIVADELVEEVMGELLALDAQDQARLVG
jgi:glycosyltransferase involved in cell wall biosynthesis